MAKTLIVVWRNAALAPNAQSWKCPIVSCVYAGQVTAINSQINTRPAGTYSNLRVYISANANNTTTTFGLLKGGASSNLSISIGAGATGSFADNTNSDTLTTGTTGQFALLISGAGNVTPALVSVVFDADSNTHSPVGVFGPLAFTTASTTRYNQIAGVQSMSITTEAQAQTEFKSSCTLRNLRASVALNARTTTTTIRTRKNAANGAQSLSIGNSATGHFEDTTNSDSIVSGDKVDYSFTTGTGNQSITLSAIVVNIDSSTNINYLTVGFSDGVTVNFNTTQYISVGGVLPTTAQIEADTQTLIKNGGGTLKNLTLNITANTVNNTSNLRVRKNGANTTLLISIGASTTGFLSDISNTSAIVDDDLINHQLVTGGTSGSMTLRSVMTELVVTAAAPAAPEEISYQSYGNVLQQFDSNKNVIFG